VTFLEGTFPGDLKFVVDSYVAEEDDAEEVPEFQVSGKIGAKKQRKLEEKQARKAQREVSISCHVESTEQSLNSSTQQRTGDDRHPRKAKAVSSLQRLCFVLKNVNSAFCVISQEDCGKWWLIFFPLSSLAFSWGGERS